MGQGVSRAPGVSVLGDVSRARDCASARAAGRPAVFASALFLGKISPLARLEHARARKGNLMAIPDVLVDCIVKPTSAKGHEGISHVGGPGAGQRWKWPVANVIKSIQDKTNTFYTVAADGKRADIAVVNHQVEGRNVPYLRTHADGKWTDNLLALKTCPN